MDGVGGFEPPNDWTKTNCLAAWLHPIKLIKFYYTQPKIVIKIFKNYKKNRLLNLQIKKP